VPHYKEEVDYVPSNFVKSQELNMAAAVSHKFLCNTKVPMLGYVPVTTKQGRGQGAGGFDTPNLHWESKMITHSQTFKLHHCNI
jgi:hypothetical protein